MKISTDRAKAPADNGQDDLEAPGDLENSTSDENPKGPTLAFFVDAGLSVPIDRFRPVEVDSAVCA